MPATFVNSLLNGATLGHAWKWDESEPSTAMLEFFALASFTGPTQNYAISNGDLGDIGTWLTWDYCSWDPDLQVFTATAIKGWLRLWTGALVVTSSTATIPQPFTIKGAEVDYAWAAMPGCWESDELGRPYRLDDLLTDRHSPPGA